MVWFSHSNVLNVEYISQALLFIVCVNCVFLAYNFIKYMFGKVKDKQRLKAGTVGRRLGHREVWFDIFSTERNGTGNICLNVSLTSKQSLCHQHVHDALVLLAKRQPMLRAIITAMGDEDRYFEIKEISEVITMLNISISDVKASDWKDVWFEYTSKRRGHRYLLWRVVILQEEFIPDTKDYANTLMLNFNHSSIDGVSCMKFCKQFLKYINEIANGSISVDQEISSLNILPYFHDIVTQKRTLYSVLNFVFCGLRPILRFFVQRIIPRVFQTMKCNPYCTQFPPAPGKSSFVGPNRLSTKVFTENETKNILQACRSNNCTVTGAITATAHLAFCELIQDGMKDSNDTKLKCGFAIDPQRFCDPKPDEDYLGLFLYTVEELYMKYESAAVDFWTVAREATEKIHGLVKAERYVIQDSMIYETMKLREIVDLLDCESLPRLSAGNFISSLGAFNFGQNQETQTYKLHEGFINTVNHGFPGIFSHVNHTINGKMSWSIVSDVSTVKSDHAETFANLCFDRFIAIAGGRVYHQTTA